MEDKITITLDDERKVDALLGLGLGEQEQKKLKIWKLLNRKTKIQAELSEINDELTELRK